MLRVQVPDRPGELGRVAGAIGAAGGDIQAVDVVEVADGMALDDLYVRAHGGGIRALVTALEELHDVKLVHATASRGHLGDDVTRLALSLQSLLDGAMTPEHAVASLVSGLLHASAEVVPPGGSVPRSDSGVLVVPFAEGHVVARRDYRFTQTERERTEAVLRACAEAARARGARLSS